MAGGRADGGGRVRWPAEKAIINSFLLRPPTLRGGGVGNEDEI